MKTRVITRTFTVTTLSVMAYDFEKRDMTFRQYDTTAPVHKMTDSELLSEIRESMETDTFKVISVERKLSRKEKRVISEDDFLKYSHVETPEEKAANNEEEKEGE